MTVTHGQRESEIYDTSKWYTYTNTPLLTDSNIKTTIAFLFASLLHTEKDKCVLLSFCHKIYKHFTRPVFWLVILCKSTTIFRIDCVCLFLFSFNNIETQWTDGWKEWKKNWLMFLFTKMHTERKMISIIYNGLIAIEALKMRPREKRSREKRSGV